MDCSILSLEDASEERISLVAQIVGIGKGAQFVERSGVGMVCMMHLNWTDR